MASTPEKKVKKKITDVLKKRGVYYFYPFSGGYGSSGVPDIICCHKGRFFAIECKAGKGKTTKLQDMHIKQIQKSGGAAIVVNETNIHDVEHQLDVIELEDML